MIEGSDIPTLFGLEATDTNNLNSICDYISEKMKYIGDDELEKLFSRYAFKISQDDWSFLFMFRRIDGSVMAVTTSLTDDDKRCIKDVNIDLHV